MRPNRYTSSRGGRRTNGVPLGYTQKGHTDLQRDGDQRPASRLHASVDDVPADYS